MTDTVTGTAVAPQPLARGRELRELGELLARARLVTLTGPAGVGKSTLAGALAGDARWTASASVDLLEAEDQQQAQALLRQAAERLERLPGERLLLLDNCDLLLGRTARFASALLAAEPGLRIVATSRESLGASLETVYPVAPLPPRDAAEYFVARAAAHHAGVAPEVSPEVRTICERLDGLPLALELAAAQTKVLTPAQIAERLDDPMRLLVGGLRTGPEHHRSLRGALDWGARTLADRERVLLRRVSVFADSFTLDAVEQVCSGAGLPETEVLEALAGLVVKSFVVCDSTGDQARYRLMRTVRQYAGELLGRSGERPGLQRARLRYALRDPAALRAADLSEALRWCGTATPDDGGDAGDGLRLATVAAPFWLLSGRIREGAELLAAELARTEPTEPAGPAEAAEAAEAGAGSGAAGLRGRVLLARGMLDCALGRAEAALETARAAAVRCERERDVPGRHWAELLAGAARLLCDPQADPAPLARAAAGLRGTSPWAPVATALRALAAAQHGHAPEAAEAAARAVAEARAGAATEGAGAAVLLVTLLVAGRVARRQGRFEAARALLAEAEALAGPLDATAARALLLAETGRVAVDQGHPGPAQPPELEQAVALATDVDSPLLLGWTLDALGRGRLTRGQAVEARGAFAQLTAVSRESVGAQAVAGILGLGEVALAAGSAGAAWTLIEEAHAIARTGAGPALLARTLQAVGDGARALGDAARAWSAYHQALALRVGSDLRIAAVESLESLAGLALEQERAEYAVRLLGAADGLRQALGSRRPEPAERRRAAERERARQLLAPDRFAELLAEGAQLSLGEAAAYAARRRGPRQRGVGWVSLTPAERQVADLAAEGLTNREIGERLFSSPRTVQAHLSHVFAKLGINSRKLLAAEIQARNEHLPPRGPRPRG
ncbi:LuxR C-terminal-related transcriptional regulator [Streptacidiphilus sp. P02-A3a]|uniref:helix-turn-helix transcriptional regulator n=1 Tax=Streptacidiphilus sp. P02-A3a TaxID=2704468 RepID=UPI0015F9866E|nr:LuxR C-terminal-related transcriptional regulator [Streptacidiphilus sp. P02-A3a]QMU73247.1 LuxR family transcriptional regulator [Streptacidiphilus sp. P02-A3a]